MFTEYNKQEIEQQKLSLIGFNIWRCEKDITNIYGETIFTKGLIYEQIKSDKYPMMLIDNKVEETEVYNLKENFIII